MASPITLHLSPAPGGGLELAVPDAHADEVRGLLAERGIRPGGYIDLSTADTGLTILVIGMIARPAVLQGVAAVITAFASRRHVDVTVKAGDGAEASYSGPLVPPDELEALIRAAAEGARPAITADDQDGDS